LYIVHGAGAGSKDVVVEFSVHECKDDNNTSSSSIRRKMLLRLQILHFVIYLIIIAAEDFE
jgi:hypothetical protein